MRKLIAPPIMMVLLLGIILWSGQAAGIEGTWLGKADIPNIGLDDVKMTLVKTETGYTGIISDEAGTIVKDTPISKIKLDGDKLTLQFPLAEGGMIEATLKVETDKMTGEWVLDQGNSGSLSFERKK
ncbi:MAG: hypothetical protein PHI34_06915 [Acidobacteriota bacterium]|nr:hypothetical protein [Acidobacteriota bacterium]